MQRHYFADKRPSSQSYVFASHVWMWELNHKEGWVSKNWCFWTVVMVKTPESPLDSKEIQPVYPKGNQSWIYIGRTDAEDEVPILWPSVAKGWLIGKYPNDGKDWRQKEKRVAEDKMVRLHHWLNGHESEQTLGDVLLNNSLVKIYFSNHLTSFCPFVSMLDSSSLTLGPFFDHDSSTSLGLFSL